MRWPAESQTPKLSNSQSADGPSLDKRKTFFGIGKVYLSEQQIADLKAGRGMGLALAQAGVTAVAMDMRGHGASGTRGDIADLGQLPALLSQMT